MASGKLQALLYKEEIEVILRTPGLGGFQLLDLHDFPGQGTALVGVLDPFWNPKAYVTAEEHFAGSAAGRALGTPGQPHVDQRQTLTAEVEVCTVRRCRLAGPRRSEWTLRSDSGQSMCEGRWTDVDLPRGGLREVGKLECALAVVERASRLTLSVSIAGTPYRNDWDLWVYPTNVETAAPRRVSWSRGRSTTQCGPTCKRAARCCSCRQVMRSPGTRTGAFEAIFWNRLLVSRSASPHHLASCAIPNIRRWAIFPPTRTATGSGGISVTDQTGHPGQSARRPLTDRPGDRRLEHLSQTRSGIGGRRRRRQATSVLDRSGQRSFSASHGAATAPQFASVHGRQRLCPHNRPHIRFPPDPFPPANASAAIGGSGHGRQ